jgi:hypothetical protein
MKYLLIISFVVLSACSTRNIYDVVQDNRRMDCNKEPTMDAQEACKKANSMSYSDYEKERKKALRTQ